VKPSTDQRSNRSAAIPLSGSIEAIQVQSETIDRSAVESISGHPNVSFN
jgi:hypothetical protein